MSFHCSEKEVISAAAFNLFELKCNKSKAIAKIFSLSEQGFKCLKTLDFKKFRCIILILFNDLVNKLDRPNPIKKAFEAIKVLH